MEIREKQVIDKILAKFSNAGFGIEKFDDETYDIVDRTLIGKAKCGSVKITNDGKVSIRLKGEAKKANKFKSLMKDTSVKFNLSVNSGTIGKYVQDMIKQYKTAKQSIYESKETRAQLENAIDSYIDLILENNEITESKEDLITYVADELNLSEDVVVEKYGNILNYALYPEDEVKYHKALDNTFFETEIKANFRNYLSEAKNVDLFELIKSNKNYKAFRKLPVYVNDDVEGKYKRLWKFVVGEFGNTINDEKQLSSVCHKIAEEDEQTF